MIERKTSSSYQQSMLLHDETDLSMLDRITDLIPIRQLGADKPDDVQSLKLMSDGRCAKFEG